MWVHTSLEGVGRELRAPPTVAGAIRVSSQSSSTLVFTRERSQALVPLMKLSFSARLATQQPNCQQTYWQNWLGCVSTNLHLVCSQHQQLHLVHQQLQQQQQQQQQQQMHSQVLVICQEEALQNQHLSTAPSVCLSSPSTGSSHCATLLPRLPQRGLSLNLQRTVCATMNSWYEGKHSCIHVICHEAHLSQNLVLVCHKTWHFLNCTLNALNASFSPSKCSHV